MSIEHAYIKCKILYNNVCLGVLSQMLHTMLTKQNMLAYACYI